MDESGQPQPGTGEATSPRHPAAVEPDATEARATREAQDPGEPEPPRDRREREAGTEPRNAATEQPDSTPAQQPTGTEPAGTELAGTGSVGTEPAGTGSAGTGSAGTGSAGTEPRDAATEQPDSTPAQQPTATGPAGTEPRDAATEQPDSTPAQQPTATGPAGTGSVGTESAGTGSVGTESAGTGSAGTEPAGTGSVGTESAGTGSAGTEPAGTEQTGTGSAGTERSAAEPAGTAPDSTAPQQTPDTPQANSTPAADPTPKPQDAPPAHPYDQHPERAAATSGNRKGAIKGPTKRPEPRGGLLMGRPFGVPVYVAPSWFLVAALITWVFGGQLDRVLPELGAARYLVSLFFAVAFYASVLIHELAHVVAALRFKLPVRRIQLQFFGGVSEIEKESETPGREFVLAFVGPLLSLVLSGVFYGAMRAVEPGTVPGVLLAGLMISNLIVAAFNLLPGLPLDGGRMLRAIVWKLTGKPMSGTIAAAWVGRALAVTVLIGLPLLTQSGALGEGAEETGGMNTLMDALLAAILAAIIWTGAGNSLRMARLREHLPDLRARTLTRRAVPVEAETPLSEALRRANEAGARALVVVDADGDPHSLVREAAIVGIPEHRRPWVPVSGLAQDLTDGMRVSAELAGEELLDTLRETPATEYLVVEENGAIYGVLSAADVERAFVKAMARPS